jgi:Sigma-70 region 2
MGENLGRSEERLLTDVRRGGEAAFERLAERYRGELYAHCYRMLGSIQDAEDALQESLLAAWKGLGGFDGRSSLRTWLYTVATHACIRLSSLWGALIQITSLTCGSVPSAGVGDPRECRPL